MFAELWWTPAGLAQAEDRVCGEDWLARAGKIIPNASYNHNHKVHRVGQANAVNIIYIIGKRQDGQRKCKTLLLIVCCVLCVVCCVLCVV